MTNWREIWPTRRTRQDLLGHACEVAEGTWDQAFIERLASLTGAATLDGDWVLERTIEHIETTTLGSAG